MYNIREEELNKIRNDFSKVISHSQGIAEPKIDKLFDIWLENKSRYIELFDGKLIYEMPEPISFEMSDKDKASQIGDFITSLYNYTGIKNDFPNFIEAQANGFYSNTVCEEYCLNDGTFIPKGMKLVKAFKYFIEDKDLLTEIQMAASRVIQKDKITGRLCFSVHPLDFLSSSENTHNWRSCHALDGEYRSGNLSYMVDKSTIVVYLKSDEEAVLPNFPPNVSWNNKKWRMLLFFSNDWRMTFAGRQYPFHSQAALELIQSKFLNKKIGMRGWSNWDNSYIENFNHINGANTNLNDKYLVLNYKLVSLNSLISDDDTKLHFNDLLYSSYYVPFYSYQIPEIPYYGNYAGDLTHFYIGGKVPCLYCGKDNLFHPESMLCYKHESEFGVIEDGFEYCEVCGQRVHYDDTYVLANGGYVCVDCFNNENMNRCIRCGGVGYETDLIYDELTEAWYCEYCFRDLMRERGER